MKKINWIVQTFIWSFTLAITFSYATNIVAIHTNVFFTILLIILVISIGIIFDMIGAASLTSNEATFHAMNSQKIKGANVAISLIKNNVRVSSICNDIIGDICGIISGGLGAMLAISIKQSTNVDITIVTIIISALISSLTVGGKAFFKQIAIKKADKVIYNTSKIISFFGGK